jgi:sterol desaturase/sphingolipid hydroxylase (fatty acid hydroxylase superfamily)
MLEDIIANYNIAAVFVYFFLLLVLTKVARYLIFLVPDFRKTREINRKKDIIKVEKVDYPPVIAATKKVGLILNLIFLLVVAPFALTLDAQAWWQYPLDIFLIIMIYDFFYYLMHRFLFHGQTFWRQVHALHHRARSPTHIDAFYVHWAENVMGLGLFIITIGGLGFYVGGIHAVSVALAFLMWTNQNTINHVEVNLPYFPFKILNYLTDKHQVHHENMHKGNYASITPLYDAIFGTLD